MTATATRILVCLAMIGAVAVADMVDFIGPQNCPNVLAPNTEASNASSGAGCEATEDPAAEETLTSTAVAGVVFVQLAITVLVAILFQRHMKPKEE